MDMDKDKDKEPPGANAVRMYGGRTMENGLTCLFPLREVVHTRTSSSTIVTCLITCSLQGLDVRYLPIYSAVYVYMHDAWVEQPETLPMANGQARRLRWSVRCCQSVRFSYEGIITVTEHDY